MILTYNIENFTENITCFHKISIENENREFHLHDMYELYLFLKGDANCFVDQTVYSLKQGNLLIFNNKELHRPIFLSKNPYERVVIHISPQITEMLSTDKTNLSNCFINREIGKNNIILFTEDQINYFLELSYKIINSLKNKHYADDILTRSYLSEILVMVNRKFQENENHSEQYQISDKIQEILFYINLNLSSQLSLESLEKTFSINRYYLSRLFKKETGSTIYNYILLKRIAMAKQLLLDGNNVTETCIISGFNDYSNFIRAFRKVTGYSPANYNKLHNNFILACD